MPSISRQALAVIGIESRSMSGYEPNDLLTERQLAEELQKSEATLARWRRAGTGPPWLRVGKSPRYRWEAVQRWLEEQQEQS
jgi:hypothetical protein